MPNRNVEVLNEVTEALIDSQKGYQSCTKIAKENYPLTNQFKERADERTQLVNQFQEQVREYGEKPVDHGTAKGLVSRDFAKFTTLFKDNEKAALTAVDKGEEHLAQTIESKLQYKDLSQPTRQLLQRAHTAAIAGEHFAEMAQRRA